MKTKLFFAPLIFSLSVLSACNVGVNTTSQNTSSTSSKTSSETTSSEQIGPEGDPTATFNLQNVDAKQSTIKQMKSENGSTSNNTTLYRVQGFVQFPSTNKSGTYYGNFDLLDDTAYIDVYGCSSKSTSIVKSGSTYSYSTSTTFSSMKISAGDYIEMEGIYLWYDGSGGIAEFQGYVTKLWRRGASVITAESYTEDEPTDSSGSYYSSISSSDTGSTLETKLHNLMDTTHTTYINYGSLYSHFQTTDTISGYKYKCFYSGKGTNSVNREHVWAQSLSGGGTSSTKLYGETYGGSDLHHLRAAISSYNSQRSNAAFGPVYGNQTGMKNIPYTDGSKSWQTGNVFEPTDSLKGDVARIIMYMYIHYSSSLGASKEFYGTMNLAMIMAPNDIADCKKLLRKWNALDPVSQEEINRNNYTASVQGNRNPFIDHPKLADRMWA